MPENQAAGWISLPPCKRKKLFLSLAAILAILCKGIRSQGALTYTITVEPSVTVQRGLAVHIPCQFTYNQADLWRSEKIFAYWIKHQSSFCFPSDDRACRPVATNKQYESVELSAKNRFHLLGDPKEGNCSLFITDARIEDEGEYFLRIEGRPNLKYSFVIKTLNVKVIEPIQTVTIIRVNNRGSGSPSSPLNPVITKEGNTVTLICTADGTPPPTLSWMKENQQIDSPTQQRLQLREIGPKDAGKYQCLANNLYGSLKTTVEVIVQYRPRMPVFNTTQTHRRGSILSQGCFKELPSGSELTAQEGDSLELFCQADSNPPATTSWEKRNGHLQKPLDNQLRLTNLTVEDEGVYVCTATNVLGMGQGFFRLSVTCE
ncbi:PREDICTED: sialic acid-binding Ig-like lectin 10 [Thamnophis sirtalis]|uniref:Sialic acid-binding Ig-like lectin 10 n=1 Tax=Thamnophis sirtalis TaxID=35019 RepID=A0A6I9WZ40_9SAUR|nr:PREDICTED: sialic acid-binding Ig-like lectin 10 [Thamnophis sirtalis]